MKIKAQADLGGRPWLRKPAGTYVYIKDDQVSVRANPRQVRNRTLAGQFYEAQWKIAAGMIAYATPQEINAAMSWQIGSNDTWKDAMIRASFGSLFKVTGPDGEEYHPADHSYPGPPEPEEGEMPWTLLATWDGSVDPDTQNIDFELIAPFTEYLILCSNLQTLASSARGVRVSTDGGATYWTGTNYVQYLASSSPAPDDRFLWPGVNGLTSVGHIMWIIGAPIGQKCCWSLFNTAGQYGTQFIGSDDPITNFRIVSVHSQWSAGIVNILGK